MKWTSAAKFCFLHLLFRLGTGTASFPSQSGGEFAGRRARVGSEQTTFAAFADSGGVGGGALDYFARGRGAVAAKLRARAAGEPRIQSYASGYGANLDSAAE